MAMSCPSVPSQPENYVPVCASVLCEAPGVIYVSIDPDVWKIRCRQCQEKTEHKCALKRLKKKFRGDPSKRRTPKDPPQSNWKDKDGDGRGGGGGGSGANDGANGGVGGNGSGRGGDKDGEGGKGRNDSLILAPEEPIPDNYCSCADRPLDISPRPNVCFCEVYKPLNFMFELEVSGEFKPAYVPKMKKGK